MTEHNPPTTTGTSSEPQKDFGAWLKDLRQQKNISLEEIAAITKIHISQLHHLEENHFDKLPSPAFVRGFLVCYAKHIGYDENEILRRFKEALNPDAKAASFPGFANRAAVSSTHPKVKIVDTPQIKHAPGSEPRESVKIPITGKHVAVGVVVIILVSTLAFLVSIGKKTQNNPTLPTENIPLQQQQAPTPAPQTPVPPAATPTPAPQSAAPAVIPAPTQATPATATQTTAANPTAAPVVALSSLELKGIESSWVKVRVDDKESQGFQLGGGASQRFQVKKKAEVSLSNAGVVEIRWNGTWYSAPGYRGDVKSLILPEQIKSLIVKGRVAAPKAAAPAAATNPSAPAATNTPAATPPANAGNADD